MQTALSAHPTSYQAELYMLAMQRAAVRDSLLLESTLMKQRARLKFPALPHCLEVQVCLFKITSLSFTNHLRFSSALISPDSCTWKASSYSWNHMFPSHSSTSPLHSCPALQQVLILQGLAHLTVTNSFHSSPTKYFNVYVHYYSFILLLTRKGIFSRDSS